VVKAAAKTTKTTRAKKEPTLETEQLTKRDGKSTMEKLKEKGKLESNENLFNEVSALLREATKNRRIPSVDMPNAPKATMLGLVKVMEKQRELEAKIDRILQIFEEAKQG
jgi:hypothetical protein